MTPKMMPGQDDYTADELRDLYAWIEEAAEGDPGERGEVLREAYPEGDQRGKGEGWRKVRKDSP